MVCVCGFLFLGCFDEEFFSFLFFWGRGQKTKRPLGGVPFERGGADVTFVWGLIQKETPQKETLKKNPKNPQPKCGTSVRWIAGSSRHSDQSRSAIPLVTLFPVSLRVVPACAVVAPITPSIRSSCFRRIPVTPLHIAISRCTGAIAIATAGGVTRGVTRGVTAMCVSRISISTSDTRISFKTISASTSVSSPSKVSLKSAALWIAPCDMSSRVCGTPSATATATRVLRARIPDTARIADTAHSVRITLARCKVD